MRPEKDKTKEITEKIDLEIKQCRDSALREKNTRKHIDYIHYSLAKIKRELIDILDLPNQIYDPLNLNFELPPANVGDFDVAIPIFFLSKILKKAPDRIAKELSDKINDSKKKKLIDSALSVTGYINIKLNRRNFYKNALDIALELKDEYGTSDLHKGQLIIIDYSSPNIAKPFGVGHLRSTVIGESLARIHNALGSTVIRDNHLGDWGTQFGALIYAYLHWGAKYPTNNDSIEELKNLYVKFTSEAAEDPTLKEKARELFVRLEHGDSDLVSLWDKFKEQSIIEFRKTYEQLNIKFDLSVGESYYTRGSEAILKDLEEKHIAEVNEEGAVVVSGLDNLSSFLLQKTDGSTLYILRDIIAVIQRKKTFNPDKIIYVVGSEQELNFRQLFSVCKTAGYSDGIDLEHVGFGLVMVEGKKMSTREGTVVNLKDVIDEIIKKSKDILISKDSVKKEEVESLSQKIGLGAIVYGDLRQNRLSPVEFNWDRMLSLESGSVVYLQYTYARIVSILRKSNEDVQFFFDADKTFKHQSEFNLALKISFYPEVLIEASKGNFPHLICNYLEDICSDFNTFYYEVPILASEDENLRISRLCLLESLRITIKNALNMLNITAIEHI